MNNTKQSAKNVRTLSQTKIVKIHTFFSYTKMGQKVIPYGPAKSYIAF